jgi:ferrous iron transport protein B
MGHPPDGIIFLLHGDHLAAGIHLLADLVGFSIPMVLLIGGVESKPGGSGSRLASFLENWLELPVILPGKRGKFDRDEICGHLESLGRNRPLADDSRLCQCYGDAFGKRLDDLTAPLPPEGILGQKPRHIAVKLLEGDGPTIHGAEGALSPKNWALVAQQLADAPAGAFWAAECRCEWTKRCMDGLVEATGRPAEELGSVRSRRSVPWDLFSVFLAFAISMGLANGARCGFQRWVLGPLGNWFPFSSQFFREAVAPGLAIGVYLALFVAGLHVSLEFLERRGIMDRLTRLFDGIMRNFGLGGKCFLPFIAGLGCTVAGIGSMGIIENSAQRRLALALCWVIPCAGTWGMLGCVASLFFGWKGLAILPFFLGLLAVHMAVTAKVFGISGPPQAEFVPGKILPPRHSTRRPIGAELWEKSGQLLRETMPVILGTTILLWFFLHCTTGPAATDPIHRLGAWLDPVTAAVGLHWRLFLVLIFAIINREAALGALAVLFCGRGGPGSGSPNFSDMQWELLQSITPAQALAFLTAFFFNVPCCAAIAATIAESRSRFWTLKLVAYYFSMALFFAAIVFHLGNRIFH